MKNKQRHWMREVISEIKNTADSALTSLSIGNYPSGFLWDIVHKCNAALSASAREMLNKDLYPSKRRQLKEKKRKEKKRKEK